MNKLTKIFWSGFAFGMAPFVLTLIGTAAILGVTFVTGRGSFDNSPFAPETAIGILFLFGALSVLLAFSGLCFVGSLKLAEAVGGRMPDGALAVTLGTLFAVVLTAAIPFLREPVAALSCVDGAWVAQSICKSNALLTESSQAAWVWSILVPLMLGYAAVVGLVIGGTVAESRGIAVMPDKAEVIPQHLMRRPAMTREQFLTNYGAKDAN